MLVDLVVLVDFVVLLDFVEFVDFFFLFRVVFFVVCFVALLSVPCAAPITMDPANMARTSAKMLNFFIENSLPFTITQARLRNFKTPRL